MKPTTKNYWLEVLDGIYILKFWKWINSDIPLCIKCKKNKVDGRSYPYCSSCSLKQQEKIK